MYDDRMYEHEAQEDDFCGCEEDKICHECRARHARHAIQAGAESDIEMALRRAPIALAEDELLIDAAIADALAARPSIHWTLSRDVPRKPAGVASIGNGLFVRIGRRA